MPATFPTRDARKDASRPGPKRRFRAAIAALPPTAIAPACSGTGMVAPGGLRRNPINTATAAGKGYTAGYTTRKPVLLAPLSAAVPDRAAIR